MSSDKRKNGKESTTGRWSATTGDGYGAQPVFEHSQSEKTAVAALVVVLGVVMLRCAWVCDDAYITFRTDDNFVNGLGMRWNVAERVQTFTHPLWMFVMSGVYFVTREAYFTSIGLGLVLSIVAVVLLVSRISASAFTSILGLILFIFSKAFMDYSTSGLENSLSYVLSAAFLYLYLKRDTGTKGVFRLSFVGGLMTLTRLDLVFLVAPAIAYLLIDNGKWKGLLYVILGFLPVLCWEIFSLFYYGSPFPNTAYAKLSTGIPAFSMIKQGMCYLLNSISCDPLTLIVISLGILLPVLMKQWRLLPIAVGMVLYTAYVVRVGGDFMSGRFLTTPFFLAVGLIMACDYGIQRMGQALLLSAVVLLGLCSPYPPVLCDARWGDDRENWIDDNGVADERAIYHREGAGLLKFKRDVEMPDHRWAQEGRNFKKEGKKFVLDGAVGFKGYFAGPDTFIMDTNALCDPLLARLPCQNTKYWRSGHFTRVIPKGYEDTINHGKNEIGDEDLSAFYDNLCTVVRGPLWSLDRLNSVWKLNTGQYDGLLDQYVYGRPVSALIGEVSEVKKEGTVWNDAGNLTMKESGAVISLEKICYYTDLEISVDHNDDYEIQYFRDGREVGKQRIVGSPQGIQGLIANRLDIPQGASSEGFDCIRVIPICGDGSYSLGHVLFREKQMQEVSVNR